MPPENAPEVLALAAYISYLSHHEVIGREPAGRGSPTIPETGFDPNPANGKVIYQQKCAACHHKNGEGTQIAPPLWGFNAYNAGAGMNDIRKAAGFIWANMPLGQGKSLSYQESLDVSAYLNMQIRPNDPRNSKFRKLLEDIASAFGLIKN
ncbi:MAG: c-type cytochrome [Methylococcales bacterium]|jgi:thiosulfate dehydrogenase|nr:c-type cytochrome [Methylococcales bacterium]MBT7408293.1 c-type cytochrome [Methylococcales bacterium]